MVFSPSIFFSAARFFLLDVVAAQRRCTSRARVSRRAVAAANALSAAKTLFFLAGCSNRIGVQVDSRLHFATSPLLIPGGQHGEEEKEGSGEEDETSEEEVGVQRFEIFGDFNLSRRLLRPDRPASKCD
jgi:hypothetical protein